VIRAVVLTQYRRVTDTQTDGQTDGIAIASTALAKPRAVQMSRPYQPKGGDAPRLGSKGRNDLFEAKTACCHI